jgi:prolyl-tRNA synthetase
MRGHTAHATPREAEAFTLTILRLFEASCATSWRSRRCPGRKSDSEKFAGAQRTYSVEAMMGGKHWALQAGTSHFFGDNFGRRSIFSTSIAMAPASTPTPPPGR